MASNRTIAGISPDLVISETAIDEVVVTQNPVESGAAVTDHAYKLPPVYEARFGVTDADGNGQGHCLDVYGGLLDAQASLQPTSATSGSRNYSNMIVRSVSYTQDEETGDSAAIIGVELQAIILASGGGGGGVRGGPDTGASA